MLQKILAMLVSLIVTLTSLISPMILPNLTTQPAAPAGPVQDLAVATVVTGNGTPAAASIRWASVDGTRVTQDHWGLGSLDELRFEVGLAAPGNVTLRLGDRLVTLHPTDVLTIRGFHGRFTFTNLGTPAATLALDGTVRSTSVAAGSSKHVATEAPAGGAASAGPGTSPVSRDGSIGLAYVVLRNGQQRDTVSYTPGTGTRVATGTPGARATEPVNLLASSVTVNGRPVTDYLHGVGELSNVTFRVASTADPYLLNVSGTPHELGPGTLVRVEGFVGSYLVFRVQDAESRVRLDGYADHVTIDGTQAATAPGSDQPPRASFSFNPPAPRTSDTVAFSDGSWDPDGQVVLHDWSFGDGATSNLRSPQHRYTEPGNYTVTLTVTDDGLLSNSTQAVVHVANTPPVADFDVTPTTPDDVQAAQFVSRAWDPDGSIVATHWDFGDGTTSGATNPQHRFPDDGNYSVTLTVTDDHGATDAVTRVVPVTNVPPDAAFGWTPGSPASFDAVTLQDASSDPDGHVVNWTWSLGPAGTAFGPTPQVTFHRPGNVTLALTVRDDDGATSRTTRTLHVRNLVPTASLEATPTDPVTGQAVSFQDTSVDRDGSIVATHWSFGDGNASDATAPLHRYMHQGTYHVNLTVTDDQGATARAQTTIHVSDAPPQAAFTWTPTTVLTGTTVTFTDQSTDADGAGTIASRAWDLGDGHQATGSRVTHAYPADGTYPVKLTVTDDQGKRSTVTRNVTVLDRPPVVTVGVDPGHPTSRDPVNLTLQARDPDGSIAGTWWILPNGTRVNDTPTITLPALPTGLHPLVAGAVDDDGSRTVRNLTLHIFPAGPLAAFATDPPVPIAGEPTTFLDQSTAGDAAITTWRWNLGDGTTSAEQDPVHTYQQPGNVTVTLQVRDGRGVSDALTRVLYVDVAPKPSFAVNPVNPRTGDAVTFRSASSDADGRIVATVWDLGDGTTVTCDAAGNCTGAQPGATVDRVVHTFPTWGTYNVTLTVTDDHGVSRNITHQLRVLDRPPHVGIDITPTTPLAGTSVAFQDASTDPDGSVVAYRWSFGDGATSSQASPTHTYTRSGTYLVSHQVTDDAGSMGAGQLRLRVASANALALTLHARLPDGQPVPLPQGFQVTVRQASTGLANGTDGGSTGSRYVTLLGNGTARAVFASGEWAGGDRFQVRVTTPDGRAGFTTVSAPAGTTALTANVTLAVAPQVDVAVDPGHALNPTAPPGSPPHRQDPLTPATGNVTVAWNLGPGVVLPARDVQVHLELIYLVVQGDVLQRSVQTVNSATVATDTNGTAAFALGPGKLGPAFAPGWYRVSVAAVPHGGPSGWADASFVEDPGGVLAAAASTPP